MKIEKSIPWIVILAISIMVIFGTGIVLKEVVADTFIQTLDVGNNDPSIGTVILNGGNDITLTETVTTSVSATATITDIDGYGDISTTTGKIYRSGVGTSCTANDNNCYSDSSCATTTPCSGNSCTAVCEYEVWFHADPTDVGTYSAEYWEAWIKVIDTDNASSSATSTGVEIDTLRALDLSTGTIDYGGLEKGADTGTLDQVQTTTATGNEAIDIYLYGTRMEKDPWSSLDHVIAITSAFEHDGGNGEQPAIVQVDTTHYLTTYRSSSQDAWAQILEVDTSDWTATSVSTFEFDPGLASWPVITQVDINHYLVTYVDNGAGWSTILEVNTSSWAVSTSSSRFQFTASSSDSVSAQIDATHYLVVHEEKGGTFSPGWAVVLNISTSTWVISTSSENPFQVSPNYLNGPAISQIDIEHYFVAYEGVNEDGWAIVLEVNTSTWAISSSTAATEYDEGGRMPGVAKVDPNHFLGVYRDGSPGKSMIFEVSTSTWAISTSSPFVYDPLGSFNPAITQMDSNHYLVVDRAEDVDGWAVALNVNTSTWIISTSSDNFEFEPVQCSTIDVARIDSSHAIAVYTGPLSDGWGAVLNPYLRNVIPVEYQEYATSGVNYASGTDLTTLATTTLELDMSKPTSHPSTSTDDVYWGLKIPSYVQKGTYYGTRTFEAKAD